jgi:single-strand DNA-binding protein
MLNRVILIGNLANDPELKYTPSGVALSSFRVAVNRPMAANAQGEREADFIDVVAWRQNAEFAANYLGKGRLVAIEGRLQVRSWVQPDGQRRKWTEVVCDNLKSLDRPRDQGQHGGMEAPVAVGAGMETADAEAEFNDPFADQ